MADERRTSRKPGRPASGRSGPRYAERLKAERKQAARDREAALAKARVEHEQRSRLTSRAAILVLVLAVLAVSYASSLRAYLEQRGNIEAAEQNISEDTAKNADLERQIKRSNDPSYVAQQARERFGYVHPGETPYIVVDKDGQPLDSSAQLSGPASEPDEPAWYDDVWESIKVAGNPPTKVPAPKNEIQAPKEDLSE